MKADLRERIDFLETMASGIVADYKRLDAACDAAMKAGAMDPNGPLHEAIWRAFQGMLERLDTEGRIAWFIYDNLCGEKEYKVRAGNGRATPVRTCRQLARIIAESELP